MHNNSLRAGHVLIVAQPLTILVTVPFASLIQALTEDSTVAAAAAAPIFPNSLAVANFPAKTNPLNLQ